MVASNRAVALTRTWAITLTGRHRSPRPSLRGSRRKRRGPFRLAFCVAGATVTATVATVAGISLSAGPAVGEPGAGLAGKVTATSSPPVSGRATSPATTRRSPAAPDASHPARGRSAASGSRASSGRALAGPVRPYLVYDSVLPRALPANHVVAVYATGPYAVPASAVRGQKQVLWVDVRGTDPAASVLDIEPGCASPYAAASWTSDRLSTYPGSLAVLYTSIAEWSLVQTQVAGLPAWMRARIRWWIANPTGYPHLVPGSDATQWYWGSSFDISTATSRLLGPGCYPRQSAAG
jgi:hypothetical protein